MFGTVRDNRVSLFLAALLWLSTGGARLPAATEITVRAAVEKQQVYVGEPFAFQIQVDGSESPGKPNLSALAGFQVEDLGGQQNSSESVTIIQGKVKRVVHRGYIFSYRLTANKAGMLVIPAIPVTVAGREYRTPPVSIRAVPPHTSKDFKLRISLSEKKAYVGQPVLMTLTWYVGANVRDYHFSLPVLSDQRFQVADLKASIDSNRAVQLPVGGTQVVAERGRGTLNGKPCLTVRFRKVLIPRQAGAITIAPATVAGRALKGYQRSRRSIFNNFFNNDYFDNAFPGFGRQPVFENFVVPSNSPRLEVLELPRAGRPANFSGFIGRFRLSAQATPTKVNVGDPITLTVYVAGPGYLGNLKLPPLSQQPALARDFRIPEERAAGVVKGRQKSFTQTIRAEHAGIRQIPAIELTYFNPDSGTYETARSRPIPLTVKGTRIITASDAEGAGEAGPIQSEIESSKGGIAFNYEGPEALVSQVRGAGAWLHSPARLATLGIPPLIFFSLLGFTLLVRWREADPVARKAKQAYRVLSRTLRKQKPGDSDEYYAAVLNALREYLGAKLGLAAAALTFADVEPALAARGADSELIAEVRRIFERCEAGRYAGAAFGDGEPSRMADSVLAVAGKLEDTIS